MIRAVVIDDEPVARRELRRLLAAHDDVVVVGDASSVHDAGDALATTPDVVFLDVKLGSASGFDLIGGIPRNAALVFITAYSEYAVDAFAANALDYLVKPVESDRLVETLRRIRGRVTGEGTASTAERAHGQADVGRKRRLTPADWLFLEVGESRSFVRVSTITHVRADDDYSLVFLTDGSVRRSSTGIGEWESALPESLFLRAHRRAIVNLGFVQRVSPWSNYGYLLYIAGVEEPVVMSRRYAARMRTLLRP
jgi:two-component system LytT family response regulator